MSIPHPTSGHSCVDCATEDPQTRRAPRPIVTAPGSRSPRCATHDRQHQRQLRKTKRAGTVARTRGISAEESHELLLFQGGTCWLCRRATGATKSLAHDHDHRHCPGKDSCRECLRGRLCGPCNKILGHFRDDPEAFDRAAAYLRGDTPWARLQASKQCNDPTRAVPVVRVATAPYVEGQTPALQDFRDEFGPLHQPRTETPEPIAYYQVDPPRMPEPGDVVHACTSDGASLGSFVWPEPGQPATLREDLDAAIEAVADAPYEPVIRYRHPDSR